MGWGGGGAHQRLSRRHDGAADGVDDLAKLADAAKDSDHPEHPDDPQRLHGPAVRAAGTAAAVQVKSGEWHGRLRKFLRPATMSAHPRCRTEITREISGRFPGDPARFPRCRMEIPRGASPIGRGNPLCCR